MKWKRRVRGSPRQKGLPFPVMEKKRLPKFKMPGKRRYTLRIGPETKLHRATKTIYLSQDQAKKFGVLPLLEHEVLHGVVEDVAGPEATAKLDNIALILAAMRANIKELPPEMRRLLKEIRDQDMVLKIKLSDLKKAGGKRKPTSVTITYRDERGIERKKRVKVEDTPEFYQQARAKGYGILSASGRRGGKFLEKLAWMLRHPGEPMPEWIPVGD